MLEHNDDLDTAGRLDAKRLLNPGLAARRSVSSLPPPVRRESGPNGAGAARHDAAVRRKKRVRTPSATVAPRGRSSRRGFSKRLREWMLPLGGLAAAAAICAAVVFLPGVDPYRARRIEPVAMNASRARDLSNDEVVASVSAGASAARLLVRPGKDFLPGHQPGEAKKPAVIAAKAFAPGQKPAKAELAVLAAKASGAGDPAAAADRLRTRVTAALQASPPDKDAVDAVFREAFETGSEDPAIWFQFGALYVDALLRLGEGNVLPPDFLKPVPFYERAQELVPDGTESRTRITLALAYLHLRAGEPGTAHTLYSQALVAQPHSEDALRGLAGCLVTSKRWSEALPVIDRVCALEPDNPGFQVSRAKVLAQLGRHRQAADVLLALPKQLNHDASTAIFLADLLVTRLQSHEEACGVLETLAASHPGNARLACFRALALGGAGQDAAAAEQFQRMLGQFGSDGFVQRLSGEIYAVFGAISQKAGDEAKAEEYYLKAIARSGDQDAAARNNLACIWLNAGRRIDEAGKLAQQAVELGSGNPAFLHTLAFYYLSSGRDADAVPVLEKAASIEGGENPAILEDLGKAYNATGHRNSAMAAWEKAIALGGDKNRIQRLIDDRG